VKPFLCCSIIDASSQNIIYYVPKRPKYIMSNLILTGFGWSEYAVAAAVALKGLYGKSDVAGVSKRRLPEYLEALPSDWKRIYIVGVSLGGDEARLANALKRLKAKGVQVSWISAYAPSESQQANVLPHLKALIGETDTLLEAVGKFFSVDVKPFAPFADEGKKVPCAVRDYHELLEAAQFAYRNYQDEVLYATAIRYLATGIRPEAWSDEVRQAIAHYRRYGGRELVGKSPQMRTLQKRINRVAQFPDARVLILGESGTGKETVAQQIHNKSPRKREPFYAFNCASVNPDLLESRFFGHEKGAYTGADKQELGLFELANGGTLFLDEIGELPLAAQGLLLRVLEGGRFMRMGGRDEIAVDVRLITATNRNLPMRVRDGKFREDLYQRLNVVQLRIPSLREHKEDIRDIADGWWLQHHRKHLADEQIAALMEYDYPGNVRELLNLMERATVLGEDDFTALVNEHKEMNAGLTDSASSELASSPDEMEAAMRLHVRHVFDKYGQNLSKTAAALKVARNTVMKYL
jgi:DNA-binding NtrC family response regulator